MKGRALTPEAKRAVLDRIYRAWCREPSQRLGQLLDNAVTLRGYADAFYIEDEVLAEAVEQFAADWELRVRPGAGKP